MLNLIRCEGRWDLGKLSMVAMELKFPADCLIRTKDYRNASERIQARMPGSQSAVVVKSSTDCDLIWAMWQGADSTPTPQLDLKQPSDVLSIKHARRCWEMEEPKNSTVAEAIYEKGNWVLHATCDLQNTRALKHAISTWLKEAFVSICEEHAPWDML